MKKNQHGFTLAELLVVVAIVGILVAISIPVFTAQLSKARKATNQANLRAAKAAAVAEYLTDDKDTFAKATYDYDISTGVATKLGENATKAASYEVENMDAAVSSKNKYEKIAIYGLSYAGETLLSELQDSSIQIAYGIDQNADSIYSDINVYSLEDSLEPVDVVVVTAITFFNEIEKKLSGKIDCPIISLEDILYEI